MRPGMGVHAMMMERIDNYLIRSTGLKYSLKANALDCFFSGVGPGVLGYDSEFGFSPMMLNADYEDTSLSSFGKDEKMIEYNDKVSPGMPWYLRCNPLDFIVPWGTKLWEESPWFAFRKMRELRDVMADPKLSHKTGLKAPYQSQMEGSTKGRPEYVPTPGSTIQDSSELRGWVELWELHDKRTHRVYTFTLDHPSFLRDEIDYLQIKGLPALSLGFNADPDTFWLTPDARLIEVQQQELNDIRTMAGKHRKVALLKVLYDSSMKKNELGKLLDPDPKAAVGIDVGPTGDIRKAVAMMQSHVPPDFRIAAAECREDIREIIGFSRNQEGAFEAPSGRRTAHEVEVVRAASMIRIDERRDILADHLQKIVQGYNHMIFEFWSKRRVIDVVGMDGVKYWVRFKGSDIKGDYAYKINPEEAMPQDERTSRNEILEFMTLAKGIPGINMGYLLREFASKFSWLDPKLLFPGEGAGRSPEKAMDFTDFVGIQSPQGHIPGVI